MDLYGTLAPKAAGDNSFISLIGGGGKTTLLINLASHLRSAGKKVLITTTTKLMSPRFHDYKADRFFCNDDVLSFFPDGPMTVLYALEAEDRNKICCPPLENLRLLKDRYDVVINEADGSKRLPLKIHTQRDPVVPDFTTYTISVMGLWAIGKKACDVAFVDSRDIVVDSSYLQWYIDDPQCLLKGSKPGSRAIIFNGAESFDDMDLLRSLKYPEDVFVCAASEESGKVYETING